MELNSTQQDTLRKFQEITNVQDREIAMVTLASLDWNLEKAIETHLSNERDDNDEQNAPPEVGSLVQPVRAARAHLPMQLVEQYDDDMENDIYLDESNDHEEDEDMYELRRHHEPSSSSSSNNRVGAFVWDEEGLEFNDNEATSRADAAPRPRTRSTNELPLIPQDSDSIYESLQNFKTVFESRYCPNNGAFMPNFHIDTLNNTIREAFECPGRDVSERRPLAIYIHNDKSVAANIFASNVICKPEVSDLLRKQFVLWGWDVTFRENLKKLTEWVRTLNIGDPYQLDLRGRDEYPLLVLLTKEKGMLKIIHICNGTSSAETVIDQLVMCVDEFASIRMNEIQEKNAREERERIRQEQAKEYEESLAADRARREAAEKEVREQKEEKERQIRAEEEEKIRRARLESELPKEPAENAPDAIHIKFRLPEGDQIMRRFRSTEKLGIMYMFLSSKGFGKEQYKYFNADFPKKEVSNWDANSSFSALKWPRREQIYVEEQ